MMDGRLWKRDVHILDSVQAVHVVYVGGEGTWLHVNSAATIAQRAFPRVHVQSKQQK